MRIFAALFFAVYSITTAAQTVEVPHKMEFADMKLVIRDDARRLIQKDVDALTQSPKHFNIKADRARTYFPIIEKIFAEEGVPDDFKYLVLQESALIADAVSVSNAVGYWQFKDFTAMEMGLRVDHDIDERKNIASSTRAAAKYIKKNNSMFDNWLYALQAYQMGAGGVMRQEKDRSGEKHAEITSETYWYVRKFLSYKIAFESAVSGKGQVELLAFQPDGKQNLRSLAKEFSIDEEELRSYNKWTKSDDIPGDRQYTILIPTRTGLKLPETHVVRNDTRIGSENQKVQMKSVAARASVATKVNGIRAIQALAGETPVRLAERAQVDLASFLKWNDIKYTSALKAGDYYLLGKKRGRAEEEFHTVSKGESLWSVSQKYGVKMNRLRKFNRLSSDEVAPGTILWLSAMKPKSEMGKVTTTAVAEVEDTETFNWTAPQQQISTDTLRIEVDNIQVTTQSPSTDTVQTSAQTLPATELVAVDTARTVIDASPGKSTHVVQAKETLYGIAHMYKVGVMDLVKWNNLDLQQGLKIGQILKVSSQETLAQAVTPQKEFIHEVQSSDTLYSIARKYGVTIKDIMEWNEKKDFSLSVGEKLKVKGR